MQVKLIDSGDTWIILASPCQTECESAKSLDMPVCRYQENETSNKNEGIKPAKLRLRKTLMSKPGFFNKQKNKKYAEGKPMD